MKNSASELSEEKKTIVELTTHKEKRTKKVVVPPKSPKLVKPKRANFLIKKLKLKGKSVDATPIGQVVVATAAAAASGSSLDTDVVGRQTPEGDDSYILGKSVSNTNLAEIVWKNAERPAESVVAAATVTDSAGVDAASSEQRTKSLENLNDMPAYGDLIIDSATTTSYANKTVSERKDHLYKIIVIGDLGSGKTSIIKRYVHRFFTQHYRATVGVDFALKVLNWDENTFIRLQLWDIAGQERYGNMTRVYYKEAVGAFIVFDVTRVNTFESVAKWKSDLDSKVQLPDGSPIPCVLLANKCDQPKEGIVNNPNKMDEYCNENGFTAWFETSAKDNINIDEAARALVTKILENDALLNTNKDAEKFCLAKETNAQTNGKSCCSIS